MAADTSNYVALTGALGTGIAGFVRFAVYNWAPIEPNIPEPPTVISLLSAGGAFTASLLATDNTIEGVPGGWMWQMLLTVEGVDYEPVTFALPFTGGASQAWQAIVPSSTITQPVPFLVGSSNLADVTSAATALANIDGAAISGDTFTGYVAPAAVSLAFASSIAVNAAAGNAFNLTLTASTGTLASPTSPAEAQVIRFRITQGAGGSYTLAYASAYDFGAAGAPTLSTTAAAVDILGFEYVASLTKWCYLGSALGN